MAPPWGQQVVLPIQRQIPCQPAVAATWQARTAGQLSDITDLQQHMRPQSGLSTLISVADPIMYCTGKIACNTWPDSPSSLLAPAAHLAGQVSPQSLWKLPKRQAVLTQGSCMHTHLLAMLTMQASKQQCKQIVINSLCCSLPCALW